MRIISKFQDYYDSAQTFGHDGTLTYVRLQKEFDFDKIYPTVQHRKLWKLESSRDTPFQTIRLGPIYKSKHFKNDSVSHLEIESFTILFCGVLYPGIRIQPIAHALSQTLPSICCYTMEDFINQCLKLGYDFISHKDGDVYHFLSRKTTIAQLRDYFLKRPEISISSKPLGEIVVAERLPALVFYTKSNFAPVLLGNPNLNSYQFFKVFDPYITYQEIEMYLGGVIGAPAPPMVPITDKDRIQQHGFDKWSFRKPPQAK